MSSKAKMGCPCPCKNQNCKASDLKCLSLTNKNRFLESPLADDFRKQVYQKQQDILTTIFEFEENCRKKIHDNEQKLDEMRKSIDLMKTEFHKTFDNRENETAKLFKELDELEEQQELEKASIINKADEKLQVMVNVFNRDLNTNENSMEQYSKETKEIIRNADVKFESAINRFKAYTEEVINDKSKEMYPPEEFNKQCNEFQENQQFVNNYESGIETVSKDNKKGKRKRKLKLILQINLQI